MATLFAALRTVAGLSLEAAAAYLKVRPGTVTDWNSGRRMPPPDIVWTLRDLIYKQQLIAKRLVERVPFEEIEDHLRENDAEAQEDGFPTALSANIPIALAWVEWSIRRAGTTYGKPVANDE